MSNEASGRDRRLLSFLSRASSRIALRIRSFTRCELGIKRFKEAGAELDSAEEFNAGSFTTIGGGTVEISNTTGGVSVGGFSVAFFSAELNSVEEFNAEELRRISSSGGASAALRRISSSGGTVVTTTGTLRVTMVSIGASVVGPEDLGPEDLRATLRS